MGRKYLFFVTVLIFIFSLTWTIDPVLAQQSGATSAVGGEESWHFRIAPYGWLTAFHGEAEGKQGRKADIDVDLDDTIDLIDEIEFAFMGRVEIEKGRWGFLFDGAYMKLEDSADFLKEINVPIVVPQPITIQGRVEVTSEMSIIQAAISYDVYRSRVAVGKRPELIIEAMAGARYNYLRTKIELDVDSLHRSADGEKNWTDPVVGGRLLWQPHKNWQFNLDADAGGFGAGSHFSSNLNGGVAYRINEWLLLNGGYRALYTNFAENQFKFEVWMHGPWLGIAFEF
jgi:hypothetical protein